LTTRFGDFRMIAYSSDVDQTSTSRSSGNSKVTRRARPRPFALPAGDVFAPRRATARIRRALARSHRKENRGVLPLSHHTARFGIDQPDETGKLPQIHVHARASLTANLPASASSARVRHRRQILIDLACATSASSPTPQKVVALEGYASPSPTSPLNIAKKSHSSTPMIFARTQIVSGTCASAQIAPSRAVILKASTKTPKDLNFSPNRPI